MSCFVCNNVERLTIIGVCGEDFCNFHKRAFEYLERNWYVIQEEYTNYHIFSEHTLSHNLTVQEVDAILDDIRSSCYRRD